MDFFSLLPIILFIYAIMTIFNPGGKNQKNKKPVPRPQRPNPESFRRPPSDNTPKTWRDWFEELERELFTKDHIPKKEIPERDTTAPDTIYETYQTFEGMGREGMAGVEGRGDEEETSPIREVAVINASKTGGMSQTKGTFPRISESSLKQGVIWAEVLGKPRALKKWEYGRK